MQETVITCDACGKKIELEDIPRIDLDYDICEICIGRLINKVFKTQVIVLRIDCKECGGKGKIRIIDEEKTYAEASCGENRTQYKTIECDNCFHGN